MRVDSELAAELDAAGVSYTRTGESSIWPALLFWVLPGLALLMILSATRRAAGAGAGPRGVLAIGTQAGQRRLTEVLNEAGFTRVRRAAETPTNMVLEVAG